MARLPAPVLKRRSSLPVWAAIGWRVLAVLALLAMAVAVHWVERDGLKDTADGHVSFLDILYFTSISVTTTGYGDIVPVSDGARMFDAFVVTPIRVFVVLIFLGTAYNFVLKRTWDKWRMAVIQRTLSGHIIVAGYGTTGAETVDELIARGTDASRIVVVDLHESNLEGAKTCGCIILQADATRDQVLKDVKIESAESMIVCAGRDDTSILITLTARHLAPALPISVIVRNEDNELPARAAGATTVVNPVSFAGLLLASSCHGSHLSDYLTDLASIHGEVQLHERRVTAEEVGKPLSAIRTGLGVRLYRAGAPHDHRSPQAAALMADDTILEIVTA
jgi:voltage-gated potassium channel